MARLPYSSHKSPTADTQCPKTHSPYPSTASFPSSPFTFHPSFAFIITPTLSLSVHRPSSAFIASISSISQVVILMLSGLHHAPFIFEGSLLFGHTFVLRSPHPIVGLKSILIAYEWPTSHSSLSQPTLFRQDLQPSSLSLLSPSYTLSFSTFLPPSFRCVSQQTLSLIVFGAFGRMCNNYHRARKRATGTKKNARAIAREFWATDRTKVKKNASGWE